APHGALNGAYTTASMDGGTGNNGNSWYELGYDTAAVFTGIPNAGSTISSAAASDHYYTFAPSYTANDVVYVDSSHSGTLTPATPGYFSTLSFLTSAGHGPVTINYSVNHADGTSETGSFNSPDWFNNTPVAWTANGRVDVGNASFNSVNGNNPRIYAVDIALLNTTSQILNINLSTSSGGVAVVFALSGLAVTVAPTAPYNVAVAPSTLTQYLGGAASFSVTAKGTLPFTYQWYKGVSPISGATTATLTLSGLAAGDAGNYNCAVGNAASTTTSGNAMLTVLPLPQGVSSAVLDDEPLAYYRLDEPGPLVADIASNSGSLGVSGNATNFPGATHQVPGAIVGDPDTAMGYSGIDINSDDGCYPTIVPFNAALNPNGSFTVEAWLQPNFQGNLGNAQAPMNNQYNDGGNNRFGWDFFQRAAATQTPDSHGPGYSFRMFNGTAGNESQTTVFSITGGQYTVGAWSHLVAVYDASVPSATLYFNGVQVAQSTSPNGTYAPNTVVPFSIGGYADGTENPFFGQIDEVAIYNTPLSASQVLTHYQNGTNAARSTSYSSVVTGDGALEYLRLDEPVKNVAVNKGSLGLLANGIYSNTGNPVPGPEAPFFAGFESTNLAVSFNGANDYVELLNPPGLNFTGPITLEAWIQPAASQGFESYIIGHGYNDDGSGEVALRIENGIYQITSLFGNAGFAVPAADLGSGQWVHLAGTYDGAQWKLYRNGVLVGTGADNKGPTLVNNANWAIGARGRWKYGSGYPLNGLDRQFNGAIDEVAFYNHALTPGRIQAHYAESVQPLTISVSGGQATLTWPLGTLQQAGIVTGPYSDVPGNPASPYTTSASGAQKYYRIRF
ncbi:MAG TPA: LamG-like jellyroll fold domain-containing protein, partial [Verrucomicrobiae bacterium]|nr:LamG-like jellyroll fold domain-containing protein [Verrucomicrobiae bacterium]